MHLVPTLCQFHKNNARNIIYMAVLILSKNFDLRKMLILGQLPGGIWELTKFQNTFLGFFFL